MGCVSSNLLNQTDDFSSFTHHFVKLTSTSYGLLNLDPTIPFPPPSPSNSSAVTPMTPPERFSIGKESNSLFSHSKCINSKPDLDVDVDVINFWELMSGLDSDTCRFSPLLKTPVNFNKENSNPNFKTPKFFSLNDDVLNPQDPKFAEKFETLCPPNGENRVVIYTTSLRGVRRTFEACNAVRAAIESFGVVLNERDISMDKGFREELKNLMEKVRNRNLETKALPPKVFIKGKYIGGVDEVMRLVEDGEFGDLLRGVARKRDCGGGGACGGGACDGCGGGAFLPCSRCNGSCKIVEGWGSDAVVVRCRDCNENGLVRCPICS